MALLTAADPKAVKISCECVVVVVGYYCEYD